MAAMAQLRVELEVPTWNKSVGKSPCSAEIKKHPKMPPMFQFPVGRRLKEIAITNQPHPISTYLGEVHKVG